MKQNIKIYLPEAVRILAGLIFIIGAILKIYPIAPLEILMVKINICNWFWAPVCARLLIGFELALGAMLISKIFYRKMLILSFITLLVFTIFLIYFKYVLGKDSNCGCFGEAVQLNPVESMMKNVVLITFLIYVFLKSRPEVLMLRKNIVLLFCAITALGFALPFMLNAVTFTLDEGNYVIKPGMHMKADDVKDISFKKDSSFNMLEGRKLVCFLSLKCPTCKYAAAKLSLLQKQNNNSLPIYIIFFDMEDRDELLAHFMSETEAENIHHTIIGVEQFFKMSDNYLPFIVYLDNGNIKNLSNFDDMLPNEVVKFLTGK